MGPAPGGARRDRGPAGRGHRTRSGAAGGRADRRQRVAGGRGRAVADRLHAAVAEELRDQRVRLRRQARAGERHPRRARDLRGRDRRGGHAAAALRDGGLAGVRGHRADRRRDPAHRVRGQPAADAGRDGGGGHRAAGADRADRAADPGELAAPDLPPGMGRPGGVIRPSAGQGRDWLAGAPGPSGPVEPARRGFLAASAATAGAAAVAGLAGRLLAERSSVTTARNAIKLPDPVPTTVPTVPPGVDLNIPGLASFITPNNSFYRVDTAIVLPEVDPSSWQLRIHGMVNREITITFDQLLKRPLIEDYVTLCCVSDPVGGPYIGNALWLGASLASLLRQAGIKAGADQLMCTSVDGFTSGTPVQTVMDGRDALLAVAMNGQPLPIAHGFPARMVVPGLYGYVSATKWVTDINVTTFAGNYAYWAQRGWAQQAPIKTECRIDVPNGLNNLGGGTTAVAGVAWAQHKGIEAVQVRVDSGP